MDASFTLVIFMIQRWVEMAYRRSTIYSIAFGVFLILHTAFFLAVLVLPMKFIGFVDFVKWLFEISGGSVLGDIICYIATFIITLVYVGILMKLIFIRYIEKLFYPVDQWLKDVFPKDHY